MCYLLSGEVGDTVPKHVPVSMSLFAHAQTPFLFSLGKKNIADSSYWMSMSCASTK